MPRKLPAEINQNILKALEGRPDGVRVEVLLGSLEDLISRRSLQRRLAELDKDGEIQKVGEGKGTRYTLPIGRGEASVTLPALSGNASGEPYIPVSLESEEIRRFVRKPLMERPPVGYRREFLDAYRPNESYYLPEAVRNHLLHIGATPSADETAGTYASQMLDRLLIDLSWASSHLEGNTYSLIETERLIAYGQVAEGKDQTETQMILNHKAAVEFLVDAAEEIGLNRYTILNLHALLSDNLLPEQASCGRLRNIPVGIGKSTYVPLAMPQMIEAMFQNILDKGQAIKDPFEQAFFAMVHLPYLQPFEDVNKRVSRLAANIPLVRQNLCPLSFIDVPEQAYLDGTLGVYELNRTDLLSDAFVWAYERSCQRYVVIRHSLGEPDPFRLRYRELVSKAVQAAVKGLENDLHAFANKWAISHLPAEDQQQFAGVLLSELEQLHEGNIARYKLRPSEFTHWKSGK